MNSYASSRAQQKGATLVVGLIMLLLFTLMVASAFILSGNNLKAVGNMQLREEALAAANIAIEQVVSSSFATSPLAQEIEVDMDNNGTADYTVEIATPVCIRATVESIAARSSATLAGMSSMATWNTVWNIEATVDDEASGTLVKVQSGVRVLLSETEKNSVCP